MPLDSRLEIQLEEFKDILKGNVVILGLGNPLKGGEGAGSDLARRLKDKLKFKVFDAGTAPENFLAKIISLSPNTLLVVETNFTPLEMKREKANLRLPKGNLSLPEFTQGSLLGLRILLVQDSSICGLSRNSLSLKMFLDILKQNLPAITIYILSIELKESQIAGSVSEELRQALNSLESFFIVNYSC